VAVTWYDVSERRRAEDKLRLQSPYDPVTGLLNAVTFSDRLEHCLRRARRGQRQFCLIKIDLQGVDALIERHDALLVGQFLRLLSQQVQRALRESDTLAWFTTHSYGAILEDERNLPSGDGVARTLLKVISTPIEVEGQMLQVSANAGLTLWDNDKQTAADLVKEVQLAVKAARAAGRNQHVAYTPPLAAQQAR
jgi:diguanylate cyclase (GGDEF)-like protein